MSEDPGTGVRALVARAQAGDRAAMETLLLEHLASLRAFVRLRTDPRLGVRESQSDLVQSICREVCEDIRGFEWRQEDSFRRWLFGLARNKLREKGRFHSAERRDLAQERRLDGASELGQLYAQMLTPSEDAVSGEGLARFEAAFARLAEEQQQVVVLARMLRLPHRAIAERLGRTEVATRKLLSRALVALSRELGREDS